MFEYIVFLNKIIWRIWLLNLGDCVVHSQYKTLNKYSLSDESLFDLIYKTFFFLLKRRNNASNGSIICYIYQSKYTIYNASIIMTIW